MTAPDILSDRSLGKEAMMSDQFVPLDLSASYNAGTGNVDSEGGRL